MGMLRILPYGSEGQSYRVGRCGSQLSSLRGTPPATPREDLVVQRRQVDAVPAGRERPNRAVEGGGEHRDLLEGDGGLPSVVQREPERRTLAEPGLDRRH